MACKLVGFSFLLFSCLILAISASPSLADNVTVTVRAITAIQETDGNLVCATIDWWPKEKCDYGWCPWYNSSIINLDLTNPILYNAVKAFKTLRIRLGGSLQDQVIYGVGKYRKGCEDFKKDPNGLFTFSSGCLTMSRWDEINAFFSKTGAILTFGLNALNGRERAINSTEYVGPWDATNARHFIKHTVSKGYKIESWEFGNELCGEGVSAKVNATRYAMDLIKLKKIIHRMYRGFNAQDRPKLLTPGGFFNMPWFAEMLQVSGPNVVNVVTHHIYNLGPGNDNRLINRILDPFYLSQVAKMYKAVQYVVRNFGPWSTPWIGESGGAYNSGGKGVSDSFVDSFWYLDQLAMVSVYGHSVFCRQALIGGNYGLLDPTTFVPNPDYYRQCTSLEPIDGKASP
ncbi:heparanase-like protein 2 [Carex littledalei]|uniref:Heparanase-like protein 2 n=1 Tax=Carex littledalei TaxID=544730 RepID=A0A833QPK7_9POAL|nr:heparanase-like protein 2 [Carex littledalei]